MHVDHVDAVSSMDTEHRCGGSACEPKVFTEEPNRARAADVLDRQTENADAVDDLLRRLTGGAQADDVDVVVRVDSGPGLALDTRLSQWIMRVNDHADMSASRREIRLPALFQRD